MSRAFREPSRRPLLAVAVGCVAAAAAAEALLWRLWKRSAPARPSVSAARGLRAGAAILAAAVLLDSGIEHYRGSFKNPAMIVAPTLALATLGTVWRGGKIASYVFAGSLVAGAAGVAFHSYNIGKRAGGFSMLNMFYAAPLGAPAALSLAAFFGLAADHPEKADARMLAPVMALALLGTAAEAGLLHFRGAFHNPVMYAPVTVPPLAAASLAASAVAPAAIPATRTLLAGTALLGIAGPLFHSYGIHRNMGGWRNWSQMILQGPPLPAPPAFLGIALAGLGLLPSLEQRRG
jgi:hypothetical protein